MKITIEGASEEVAAILAGCGAPSATAPCSDERLSTSDLAKLLGIHPRRVQSLAKDGVFHRMTDEDGRAIYDVADSVKNYCAHLRATAQRRDANEFLAEVRRLEPEIVELIVASVGTRAEPQS